MKEIFLTQGKVAIVDDADYERISRFKWRAWKSKNTWYAARSNHLSSGIHPTILMHREILGIAKGLHVDHKDGDGLNNTRANLRACTNQENCLNRRPRQGSASRYKGITYREQRGRWEASITVDGKRRFLGRFRGEEEAARAYDEAARSVFGEFARTNFQ